MKNKISDLRDHMFAALERLNDDSLTGDELKTEITRAQAVSEVGKVIVDSAKTEVMYMKVTGKRGGETSSTGFIDEDDTKNMIERPKAEYSNHSPMRLANAGS